MLKFEIDKEGFEALDENVQGLYEPHGDGFRLKVEGIDPADEIKEALRKEREERAEAKRKLQELEKQREEDERARLERDQEYERLYKQECEARAKVEAENAEFKRLDGERIRTEVASKIVNELTRDSGKARHLLRDALEFVHMTPDGVKINGPDGEAWDANKLSDHLKATNSFLIDGSGAAGGGASGGGGDGVTKKFNEYTGAELKSLRESDPDKYNRLRDEYHGAKA
jgi:DNA repair exonuclease SbcCD ATPase subunit